MDGKIHKNHKIFKERRMENGWCCFFNANKSKSLLLFASIDPDTSAMHDEVQIAGAEKLITNGNFTSNHILM